MNENRTITARLKIASITDPSNGQATITFGVNYLDPEGNAINQEWAKYTPGATVILSVREEIADLFEVGEPIHVTFSTMR